MIVTKNLKEEILEQLKTKELVRIPASEEEYFSVAYDLPFKIEYHDSEIITMGLASYMHEILVMTLGRIIGNLLFENDNYTVLGSNTGVKIPKFEGGYFMPDVLIMKGLPVFSGKSKAIITNPYLIVEISSPGTKNFDFSEKLPEYKHLESLNQIIFVSQNEVKISSFIRSNNPNIWLNQDFYSLSDEILIENKPISLKDIYRKIEFEK